MHMLMHLTAIPLYLKNTRLIDRHPKVITVMDINIRHVKLFFLLSIISVSSINATASVEGVLTSETRFFFVKSGKSISRERAPWGL